MKIRWGRRTFIWGRKAKEEYRAQVRKQAREIVRIAKSIKDAPDKPVDFGKEFEKFTATFGAEGSPFSAKMGARDRIIAVTSFLDEQLRWLITLKMAGSRGSFPSRSELDSIFVGTGTLATFADKIRFCSVFKVLPDELKGDIGILKEIRNRHAAHSFMPISFDDPEIATRCQDLKRHITIAETRWDNENERKFMEAAWSIVIILILVAKTRGRLIYFQVCESSTMNWTSP